MKTPGRVPSLVGSPVAGSGYEEPSVEQGSTAVPIALDCSGFVGTALAGATGAPVQVDYNPFDTSNFTTRSILAGSYGAFTFVKADGPAKGVLGLLQFPGGKNHVVIMTGANGFIGSQEHHSPQAGSMKSGESLATWFGAAKGTATSFYVPCVKFPNTTASAPGGSVLGGFNDPEGDPDSYANYEDMVWLNRPLLPIPPFPVVTSIIIYNKK